MSTSIPIPPSAKPIQLYLWANCGYCTKQKQVIESLDAEMSSWFVRNVCVTNVQDPKLYPSVPGYPYWVVRGRPDSGLKNLSSIVNMRRLSP